MFRISDAEKLGLHAMALLAAAPAEGMTVSHMARRLHVSEAHLAKVMQRLSRAGLAASRRGPSGGFRLGRPADTIRLIEIHECIEGPWAAMGCLLGEPVCAGGCCALGNALRELDERAHDHMVKTLLSDLCPAFAE